jgi:hypothetical protein
MPYLLPVLLLTLFGFTLWGSRIEAPTAENTKIVPLKTTLQWDNQNAKGERKADYDATFTSKKTGEHLGISLYDNGRELRISDEDAPYWTFSGHRYAYGWDKHWDVGAFIAARPDCPPGYDLGIRVSPARVLYGVLAPDLLVGSRSAGVGVSVYAPADLIPRDYGRFGLGLGYLADYSGDRAGVAGYLSVSTHF